MRLLFLLFVSSFYISCNPQECSKMPVHFSSYDEAIKEITKYTFKLKESADMANSSWMRSATYYSCDGQIGYFIYSTDKGKKYIHADVPLQIWRDFQNAISKGSYYDNNIRRRYRLNL
jgi:KTSC domain